MTRGKRLVGLVGQIQVIAVAVRNVTGRQRWSKLAEWLNGVSPHPTTDDAAGVLSGAIPREITLDGRSTLTIRVLPTLGCTQTLARRPRLSSLLATRWQIGGDSPR